jgi:trk system potassium uptake protein TrkH
MNYKMMGRFIGLILMVEAVFMIPAGIISLCYGEYTAMWAFWAAMGACLAVAGVLLLLCKGAPSAFYAKEGLVCVGLSWIVLSLFGSLPFFLSREIPRYIDAFFEIVSGFTTTGASILPEV